MALVDAHARGAEGTTYFIFVYKVSSMAAKYPPFGRIIKGMNLIDELAASGHSAGEPLGRVEEPLRIISVEFG